MTKQEFIERVNVNVNDSEYEHIEAVYMASDVDKDTFCKMWVKMNQSRVKAALQEVARREQFDNDLMFLHTIANRFCTYNATMDEAYTKKEISRIEKLGIGWYRYADDVKYEAQQLLHKMIEELRKAA